MLSSGNWIRRIGYLEAVKGTKLHHGSARHIVVQGQNSIKKRHSWVGEHKQHQLLTS